MAPRPRRPTVPANARAQSASDGRPSLTADRSSLIADPRTWIVLASACLHALALVQLGDHPLLQPTGTLDDGVYVTLARRVAAGDLALAPEPYFLAPLYTYLLGFVFALTGGSIVAARVVQGVLGVAAVWLVIDTTERWFGTRAAIAAGLLATTTGLFVFNELLILQSSIDPFLTALALWTTTRAVRAATAWRFLFAGMAIGLLALNRPNALVCLPALAVAWVVAHVGGGGENPSRRGFAPKASETPSGGVFWRASFAHAAALVLGGALIIAPVTIRNRVVAGEWVAITSHGGLNFYIGNATGADGTWKAVPGITPSIEGQVTDVKRMASDALGHTASAREASDWFYARAWSDIASAPGAWLRLLARKVALTFSAHDAALNHSYAYFARDERSVLSLLVVGPTLLVPAGLVGLVCGLTLVDDRRRYLAWSVFLPAYAATLIAFFVSSRYRLPLLVVLCIGGGAFVAWLLDRVRAPHRRAAESSSVHANTRLAHAAPLAAFALLVGLVQWPLGTDDGRMNERMERAVQMIRDGQVDDALALVARTEGEHDDPALLWYRVGMGLRDRGDLARATTYLARAAAAAPESADVRMAYGEALLEAGRPTDALPHLEAARAEGLASAALDYALAHAYHAAGRRDDAVRALRRIPPSSASTADLALEYGRAAFQLGDASLAETHFARATTLAPGSAEAWEALGVSRGAQGQTAPAYDALRRAASLDGSRAPTHVHLALLYARAGDLPAAMAELDIALRIAPGDADAGRLKAQLSRGR